MTADFQFRLSHSQLQRGNAQAAPGRLDITVTVDQHAVTAACRISGVALQCNDRICSEIKPDAHRPRCIPGDKTQLEALLPGDSVMRNPWPIIGTITVYRVSPADLFGIPVPGIQCQRTSLKKTAVGILRQRFNTQQHAGQDTRQHSSTLYRKPHRDNPQLLLFLYANSGLLRSDQKSVNQNLIGTVRTHT